MICVVVLAIVFASLRLLLRSATPTCNASFQVTQNGLCVEGVIHGRDAELHRVLVLDPLTGDDLYSHSVKDQRRRVDFCIDPSLYHKKPTPLVIRFIGSYVPFWPPALSRWKTEYKIRLVGTTIEVVDKHDTY
jgi:hypothetical protein